VVSKVTLKAKKRIGSQQSHLPCCHSTSRASRHSHTPLLAVLTRTATFQTPLCKVSLFQCP